MACEKAQGSAQGQERNKRGHGPRRNNAGARQMMVGKAEEIAREGPGQIKKQNDKICKTIFTLGVAF